MAKLPYQPDQQENITQLLQQLSSGTFNPLNPANLRGIRQAPTASPQSLASGWYSLLTGEPPVADTPRPVNQVTGPSYIEQMNAARLGRPITPTTTPQIVPVTSTQGGAANQAIKSQQQANTFNTIQQNVATPAPANPPAKVATPTTATTSPAITLDQGTNDFSYGSTFGYDAPNTSNTFGGFATQPEYGPVRTGVNFAADTIDSGLNWLGDTAGAGMDWMKNNADVLGMVGGGINALSGAAGAWAGLQQAEAAQDQLNFQKDVFAKNWANQVSTTNTALRDRQAARSSASSYAQRPDEYMKQHGVK